MNTNVKISMIKRSPADIMDIYFNGDINLLNLKELDMLDKMLDKIGEFQEFLEAKYGFYFSKKEAHGMMMASINKNNR